MGLSDFHTRKAANDGIKVVLSLPNGNKSDHFLMIRGIDSDEFRRAETAKNRALIGINELSDDAKESLLNKIAIDLISSLVIGWSFDDEFIQLARSVYIINDERSRIKRKINDVFGSEFVEEKSYPEY